MKNKRPTWYHNSTAQSQAPDDGYILMSETCWVHKKWNKITSDIKLVFFLQLFLVYFVNLYTFRAYLGPSSGGTAVCIKKLVLIFLFRWLSVVLFGLEYNPTRTSHLKRIISTNCCIHTAVPPDDGPRYARNMYRLTKYIKNKLCIKLVYLYTIILRCTDNKTQKVGCLSFETHGRDIRLNLVKAQS